MTYNKFLIDKENIYTCGDIHFNFKHLLSVVKKNKLHNCAIILLGDVGIGLSGETTIKPIQMENYLNNVLEDFKRFDIKLIGFRGNHDNPSYFKDNKVFNDTLYLVDDYTVLTTLNNVNILVVGGAISIDRLPRLAYNYQFCKEDDLKYYYLDEQFYLDKELLQYILDNEDITHVMTHTAPSFCNPIGFNQLVYSYTSKDEFLENNLIDERKLLTEMHDIIVKSTKIKTWSYGHFHYSNTTVIDDVKFMLHDISEIKVFDYAN